MAELDQPIDGLEKIGSDLPASDYKVDPASQNEEKKLFGDDRRNETLKEVIHGVFVKFIQIAAGAFMIMFLVRVIHFILPENGADVCVHGWLSETQLQGVDKLFFSGAVGAMISRYMKGIFSDKGV